MTARRNDMFRMGREGQGVRERNWRKRGTSWTAVMGKG